MKNCSLLEVQMVLIPITAMTIMICILKKLIQMETNIIILTESISIWLLFPTGQPAFPCFKWNCQL